MNRLLGFAAIAEAATGLALLLVPSLVGQMLVGAELTGIAVIIARVAGIALLALGVACRPGTPLLAMVGYGAAITIYRACLGSSEGASGVLLWPAVLLLLILAALLARTARKEMTSRQGRSA